MMKRGHVVTSLDPLYGLSAKEIAESLGMTASAVYVAKRRVLARVKQQVQLLQGEET